MKTLVTAFSLLLLCLFGCKKEDITQKSLECFQKTQLDSSEVANKLIGKWNWYYSYSGWIDQNDYEINKGMSLEFNTDGSLIIKRSGKANEAATWKVQTFLDNYHNLIIEPFLSEGWGTLMFCGDQMLFYDTPADGLNNYFKRD